jgi:hypothetical protein
MSGVEVQIAVTASSALAPRSIRAMPRSPSRLSVRCCDSTAPRPCESRTQRAPTARSEVVIAAPNAPLRSHRAMIEKVMGASYSGQTASRVGIGTPRSVAPNRTHIASVAVWASSTAEDSSMVVSTRSRIRNRPSTMVSVTMPGCP